MNKSERCHEIRNCEGLYIDAFATFKLKTHDRRCSFILTHYHADHYSGLPKNNKYKGPALIHCTPVTAALLRHVHEVDPTLIVEHPYGVTWTHEYRKVDPFFTPNTQSDPPSVTEITFYDANHCPGAAIILARLTDSDGTCHVHTGDMRYHEKFLEYPLLKAAVIDSKIDHVYLDTTYAHPKHCFPPQQNSVDMIASQVKEILNPKSAQSQVESDTDIPTKQECSGGKTLVLLSCYSVGKEKVLWAAANQSNQMVYVNNPKYKRLECIKGHTHIDPSSGILGVCTQDANKSDLHVIPMGTAGNMFPYFIPNFEGCAKYANNCDKDYARVVAFIPTGWAEASNYNKKNSVSKKAVTVFNGKQGSSVINVEIRLVPYSEHSSFEELRSFVEFLRPKRVIPTVFSSDKDCVTIEMRFKDLIDSYGVKLAFVNSMSLSCQKRKLSIGKSDENKKETKLHRAESKPNQNEDESVKPGEKQNSATVSDDGKVATLISMGFDPLTCNESLRISCGDINKAIERLLQNSRKSTAAKKGSGTKSARTITNFFSRKRI